MEQNTKTILLAVLILLIAIVSFNFTGMTGETVGNKEILKITSHPDGIVHRGEIIKIKVTPTKEGIDNRYMYIYRENGARMQNSKAWVCGRFGNICYEPSEVVYNTLGTYDTTIWPEGTYIIRIINHKTNGKIDTKFRLVE
jgi:hypothetical protein